MKTAPHRDARVTVRLRPRERARLEKAAEAAELTLSEFLRASLLGEARTQVQQHQDAAQAA